MKLPIARFLGLVASLGICAALIPGAANSATLTVNASVAQNCIVSAGTLNFGSYDPVQTNNSANLDQSTTVTVTCTKNSSFTNAVTLAGNTGSNGNSSGACSTTRSMKSGSNVLCYDLYTDSPGGTVWNSSTHLISVFAQSGSGGGISGSEPQSETIYGRIPGGQDASVGSYTDSVTMSVNF